MLAAEREAAVVERRIVDRAPGAHLPRPYARELGNPAGEDYGRGNTQLGLDEEGRVVIERRVAGGRAGEAAELYSWGLDWCEVVALGPGAVLRHLHVFNLPGGELTEEIALDGQRLADGQLAVEVRRWHYDDGRPQVALDTYEREIAGQSGWGARRYGFIYDAFGGLEQITYATARDVGCGPADADDAQAAAHADSARLFSAPAPLFDARENRRQPAIEVRAQRANPVGPADALTALLSRTLAHHEVDVTGAGFDLAGDPNRLERVWQAVQAFAAAPVDDLYPGLRIPLPGYPDMDGLSLDLDTRGPVVVTFERRVYLVDAHDEHQDSDVASLSFHVDVALPKTRTLIEGVGGPPNDVNDGARSWIAAVDNHPLWAALCRSAPTGRVAWY